MSIPFTVYLPLFRPLPVKRRYCNKSRLPQIFSLSLSQSILVLFNAAVIIFLCFSLNFAYLAAQLPKRHSLWNKNRSLGCACCAIVPWPLGFSACRKINLLQTFALNGCEHEPSYQVWKHELRLRRRGPS